jgi:DNA-binding beta-propeller fold protein YncE
MAVFRGIVRDRASSTRRDGRRGASCVLAVALLLSVLSTAAGPASAQTVGMDRPFGRVDAMTLPSGEGSLWSSAIDPAGRFAYVVTRTDPGRIVKLDLATFTRVGALALNTGESNPWSIAIRPDGRFAYVGTGTNPARLVEIDLDTFTRTRTLILSSGDSVLLTTVIDPAGRYAYLGTDTTPGRLIKIDLQSFNRVGTMTLSSGENSLGSGLIDPAGRYLYLGTHTAPGRIVKIDLQTFSRVGTLALQAGENNLFEAAVMDPAGRYAYFGTYDRTIAGKVVKVDLQTFTRVGAVSLPGANELTSAVIEPSGRYAYFGAYTGPGQVVEIDLASFTRTDTATLRGGEDGLTAAFVDPAGRFAYFGTYTSPARVIKVAIGPDLRFAPPRLATTYGTADGWGAHVAADTDGDRRDELFSYHSASGRWWQTRFRADGTARAPRLFATYGTKDGWDAHLAADVDGDGRDELVSYHRPTGRWWATSTKADGTAKAPRLLTTYPEQVREGWGAHLAGDMNGDGRDDLLSYQVASGQWGVTWSLANDKFDGPWVLTTYATKTGWGAHLAADVTGNGRAELLSYHPSNGRWWVSIRQGDGSFATRTLTTYGTRKGWAAHVAADLNGSGRADLVSYHPTKGRWWVTSVTADGVFRPPSLVTTYGTTTGWAAHLAADVDGDGRAELLSYHPARGRWWLTASVPAG